MTPRRIASASFRFSFAFLSPTRERSRGARGDFPRRARGAEGARERPARSAPSLTQFGITGGDRLEDVHPHPSICTTERRRRWSLRPQALSERGEPRYTGRQSLECLERRGCGAVSRTLKINPYSGMECVVVASRRASAGARVSVRQHKLVRARGNRQISDAAGIRDQGQISKLLARLEVSGYSRTPGAKPMVARTRGISHPAERKSCRCRAITEGPSPLSQRRWFDERS